MYKYWGKFLCVSCFTFLMYLVSSIRLKHHGSEEFLAKRSVMHLNWLRGHLLNGVLIWLFHCRSPQLVLWIPLLCVTPFII